MMRNEDDRNDNIYQVLQETDIDPQRFVEIKKDQYSTRVFCWIQQGDTTQVIKFYNTFPHLINEIYTPNHWNPLMYAVRYSNLELVKYLFEKGMKTNVQGIYNHVSIIHAAVYSGKLEVLSYVLKHLYKSANPPNSQTSPLKIAMKTGNPHLVELLISRGAYYIFYDVYNNLTRKQSAGQEASKYITLDTNKQISMSLVVQDTTIKDCPIKETLRWARLTQTIHLRKYAQQLNQMKEINEGQQMQPQIKEEEMEEEKQQQMSAQKEEGDDIERSKVNEGKRRATVGFNQKHNFYDLAHILLNDDYYDGILRTLVGKGQSICAFNKAVLQDDKDRK